MLKCRKALALFSLLMLLASLSVSALADTAPEILDVNHPGSLKVHILETGTKDPVPGGKVAIYQVASPVWKKDAWLLPLTSDFADSGFDTSNIQGMTGSQNAEEAQKLSDYAEQSQLKPLADAVPDGNGTVEFKELPLGLYLVVQLEAASEYDTVAPFLITVPQVGEDSYVYDVDAAPKTGTANHHTTEPTKPDHHGGHHPYRPDHILPQTGQLWWPVFLMASAGVILFAFGYCRRRRSVHE